MCATYLVLLQHALVLLILDQQSGFTLILSQRSNSQLLLQQRNFLLVLETEPDQTRENQIGPKRTKSDPAQGASYLFYEGIVMAIILHVTIGGGGVHVE